MESCLVLPEQRCENNENHASKKIRVGLRCGLWGGSPMRQCLVFVERRAPFRKDRTEAMLNQKNFGQGCNWRWRFGFSDWAVFGSLAQAGTIEFKPDWYQFKSGDDNRRH